MTRAQIETWRRYCTDPLDKIEHYEEALAEGFKCWCIHHRREIKPDGTRVSRQELKDNGLYYDRPANELVFMRLGEHRSLHNIGNKFCLGYHHSEDHRRKNSLAHRGKHNSAEHRKKIAEANCGMLWWNNGISNKRSRECPGEGWKRGMFNKEEAK